MTTNTRLTEAQLNALPQDVRESILATYAALDAKKAAPAPTAKVAKGGGISVYGLGRFPVTLSVEQWKRLFSIQDKIQGLMNLPQEEFAKRQAEAQAKAAANPFSEKK